MAQMRTPVDWKTEETYWRQNYKDRPYARTDRDYEFYSPAYRFGYDAANRYDGKMWEDTETALERDWDTYEYRGQSTWEQVKQAVKDAWDRVVGDK